MNVPVLQQQIKAEIVYCQRTTESGCIIQSKLDNVEYYDQMTSLNNLAIHFQTHQTSYFYCLRLVN